VLTMSTFHMPFKALAQFNVARAAIIFIVISLTAMGPSAFAQSAESNLSINDWLLHMHEAAMKKRSYVGTLVQSSPQAMSSARIWHACDGNQQMERVETLTGAPSSTFRHNDKLVTFMPEAKVVRVEKREKIGGFPELLKPSAGSIPEFYGVKTLGSERVAGLDADMVQLLPKDALRFGYRIWTEKKSSLVVKMQTLDATGAVIEQAAFSELQLDAPVKMDKLLHMMAATEGYKIDQTAITKTTAAAEGWVLKSVVPGFKPLSCYKRANNAAAGDAAAQHTLQWIFSDGLATVSLFVEEFDKTRHTQEGLISSGATHTLLKRMNEFWLTAVGEVPPQTLKSFAQSLERKK
jgi:sigma-E factor negative regulatory protein RseB